jgi:Entner-Doudoroff aldolase
LQALERERCLAIVRASDAERARRAMRAAVDGGFRVIEFTLTTPGALKLVHEFSANPELVVGAGTVLTTADATQAVAAGASFLVSPVLDLEVVETAGELGVPMAPGTVSPTEMHQAHLAGAPLQKLFPAPPPPVLRSILGPLPFLRLVPTSGVTAENAAAYLEAGAFAVGFVSSLFDPEDLRQGRYDRIRQRSATLIASLAEFR